MLLHAASSCFCVFRSDANISDQNYSHRHECATKTQEYELAKFWQIISRQQSILPLIAEDGRCRPGDSWHKASVQTDGRKLLFHNLLNSHIDVVILCCDWDSDPPCILERDKQTFFCWKSHHVILVSRAPTELPASCCQGRMLSPRQELTGSISRQTGGSYFPQAVK